MFDSLHRKLVEWSTAPVLVSLALVLVGCTGFFAWRRTQFPAGTATPDSQFSYTKDQVGEWFKGWGTAGRRLYLWSQLTVDLLTPLTYGLLFAIVVAWLIPAPAWRWTILIPIVAALGDLGENAFLVYAAATFEHAAAGAWARCVPIAQVCTRIKWIATVGLALTLVAGFVARWYGSQLPLT